MHQWSLSDFALDRPVTVGMLLVAVLLLGAIGLNKMPLSFLPADQAARMFVRVNITHTSPEVLEREVIRPLEEQIAGIRDLQRIQTGSGSWGVRINLDFEPGTDVDARKIELRDRIERVRGELPDFVQNLEIGSYSRFDDPVMEIQISSGTDLSEDYYLIEERIVRPIERIRGVARVELDGVAPHELEVSVDLEQVARTGVSLEELGQVVRDARQGRTMGSLRDASRQTSVRSPAAEGDAEHFASLPLRRAAERSIPSVEPLAPGVLVVSSGSAVERGFAALGEVAKVSTHPEVQRRGRRLNGRKAINLEVFAAAGASTVDVTERIRETVRMLEDDTSLDGIELLVIRDQGTIILKTLADLRDAGIWGGTLGIVVLFLFLHRLHTTLAAAVCIPASVLAACAVLFLRGEELNCVVMLGLVLGVGMLIDNAVVIVEAIAQHARRGEPPSRAARLGAREVGFATIASTLSSVIVFIPLVVGDPRDEMTTYLVPLGTTFAIGLIASLLVSQTVAPLLMVRLSARRRGPARELRHPVLDRLADAYAWIVTRTLRFPRLTVLCGLVVASSAVYPATKINLRLGGADIKADNLPIRMQIAGSRNMEKISELVIELESALLAQREALNVDAVSCSYSDHWGNCRLYPAKPFQSERDAELFEERVQRVLPDQTGVEYRLGERDFDWRENRDRKVVEFAIKGEDMGELMSLSAAVAEHLAKNLRKGDTDRPEEGGYDTITTPFTDGARELHVALDGDRLRRLGLSADDIAQRVSMAFQGLPLGKISGERGELRLRLSADIGDKTDGAGLARLRDLRLPLAEGRDVPLGSVAEIELARLPWWIQRVDRQTEVRLKVRFFSEDMSDNWDTVSAAMKGFTFPPGYTWGRGTMWKQQRESSNEMLINLALCLLLVYAVMASLFESFLQPFGILVTCLLGCFGALWALWATNTTLDTTAAIGFILLIGIVVNNGIMLIDKVTQLRGQGVTREEALRQAGRARLRPILMTVTTTVLGLVPMLIHHPTLAGVYYHAIAIVVAGGLLTSTLITLLFLPAAYTVLEGIARGCRDTWRRFAPSSQT